MNADGVIGTAMKSCIHKHLRHLDQRPLGPPKLNNAILVEVILAASDQGVWGAFVPFHGCSNDNIGGRGQLRRPEEFCRKNRPLSTIQFIAGGKIYWRCC